MKNIPSTKNKQFLKNLFSQHGEVHGIQKDKDRSNVYYVVSVWGGGGQRRLDVRDHYFTEVCEYMAKLRLESQVQALL